MGGSGHLCSGQQGCILLLTKRLDVLQDVFSVGIKTLVKAASACGKRRSAVGFAFPTYPLSVPRTALKPLDILLGLQALRESLEAECDSLRAAVRQLEQQLLSTVAEEQEGQGHDRGQGQAPLLLLPPPPQDAQDGTAQQHGAVVAHLQQQQQQQVEEQEQRYLRLLQRQEAELQALRGRLAEAEARHGAALAEAEARQREEAAAAAEAHAAEVEALAGRYEETYRWAHEYVLSMAARAAMALPCLYYIVMGLAYVCVLRTVRHES